jgi:hypothetical protein
MNEPNHGQAYDSFYYLIPEWEGPIRNLTRPSRSRAAAKIHPPCLYQGVIHAWILTSLFVGPSRKPILGTALPLQLEAQADPSRRPLQRAVISAALDGDDVFVQAATSFGKSLCFQLPAVIDHGSTFSFA